MYSNIYLSECLDYETFVSLYSNFLIFENNITVFCSSRQSDQESDHPKLSSDSGSPQR